MGGGRAYKEGSGSFLFRFGCYADRGVRLPVAGNDGRGN